VLIVDAAYLFQAAKTLEKETNRKLIVNPQTMGILIEYMG